MAKKEQKERLYAEIAALEAECSDLTAVLNGKRQKLETTQECAQVCEGDEAILVAAIKQRENLDVLEASYTMATKKWTLA